MNFGSRQLLTETFLGSKTVFESLKTPIFGTKYNRYQADSVVPTRGRKGSGVNLTVGAFSVFLVKSESLVRLSLAPLMLIVRCQ